MLIFVPENCSRATHFCWQKSCSEEQILTLIVYRNNIKMPAATKVAPVSDWSKR